MTTPQPDAWANNPQYKQQPKPIAPPEPKQPQQQQAQPQQAQPQPIQHDTSQPWYQYGMSTVKGTEQGDLNNAIQRYLATPRNYWTWQRDEQAGLRGFWENPYRVARYHDVIQSAPDGWQPPDWLDVDGVKAAYKWFEQRNDNKPWYQWQQLPDDDPATPFLRGMKVPPDEYLWGGEEYFKRPLPQDYQAEQQRLQKINAITPQNVQQPQSELNTATEYAKRAEVKADPLQAMGYKRVQDWKDMPAWAKVYLSMFSGQPMQGRPAWSQATGSLLPSIPGVVGAAGTGAAIGGLVAGPPGAAIGMIGLPLLIGAEGAYENVTGSQVTGLADVFSVFDILAEGLERVVATPGGVIGASDGTAEGILKVLQDKELMGAIWQAGHMAQETSLDNPLLPGKQIIDLTRNLEAMAKENVGPADILLGNYKWQSTPEGMTWKLSQGYVEPVPVLNRNRTAPLNGNIQQEVIDRLWDGEPLETVYADILDRYGDVGAMNDFIGHLVYDPLNFVPAAATAAGVKVGDISGNPRLSAAFEAGKGNLLIDALPPGIQQLAEKLTGVQGTQSPLTAIRTYKAMVEGGTGFPEGAIPEAKDLHWMDKAVLGLDENGQYKELQAGSGKWYNYLRNMTPESKSSTFIAMLMDNLSALSLEADDPNLDNIQKSQEVIKLVQQYANVRPVEAGEAGEAIMKNPMTATTSAALRQVVKSGVLENMAAEWAADQPKVSMLENMAKILNVDSSALVKDLKSDPQTVLLRLVETARRSQDPNAKSIVQDYESKVLTPESLKDQFAVFTDGNHSWKFGEWRAKTMLAIDDMAWDFTKEHFGIKESSAMNKFFMLAKAAQSALLLDMNPAYLVNNALNNWVTRATEGVFGYMTKDQLDGWDNRFGLSPARLEIGLGTEEGGRLGQYMGDVRKINLGEGKLAEIIKNVNKTRQKFGLMSKLSGELEKSESRQAYTIAMKRTWDQLWRPGRGFDKMPAALEQALRDVNPDLPGYVYAAIRSGMNMDEVINNIYKPAAAVNVVKSIDDAAAKIFKDNPDVAVQLIKDLGIDETLRARLANAKTVDDVDRAFNVFNREVDDLLDRKTAQDILDAGDEAAEQVKAKGFSGAVELFNEMITSLTDHWVAHFGAIEDMLARLDEQDADFDKRNLAWRDMNERDSRSWKRINDFELQVTSGILRVLGIDNAAGAKYLELTRGNMDQWREFYDGYDVNIVTGKRMTPQEIADNPMMVRHVPGSHDLWREYFATDWKKQPKGAAKAAAAQIKQKLSEMYQVHASNEQNMQGELDNLFSQMFEQHTGRPAQDVLGWRQSVWEVRARMIEAMTAYRNDLMAGKAKKTWQQFLDTEYKPLMLEMKKAEMVGAEKILWGEQAKPTEAEPLTPEAAVAAHVEAMDVLKEAETAKQEAQTKVDAHLNKDTLFKQMRDTFNLGKDEYTAARMMADLHAERWAERTGRKAEEWYASHLAGFLRGEGDVDFRQAEQRSWYYSQLQRTIEQKMPNKATPEQIRGMLQGQVKADELQWSGFDEWLARQKGSVSKQDVIDFLQENQVVVNEVVHLSKSPYHFDTAEEWQEAIYAAELRGDWDESARMIRAWEGLDEETGSTAGQPKFSTYTLPGGENYRELLLTLPGALPPTFKEWYGAKGYSIEFDNQDPATKQLLLSLYDDAIKDGRVYKAAQDVYKSSHWSEPNVLAHIRFNDRTDVDGKRVLFLEEIQSDWHQQGRDKGYKDTGTLASIKLRLDELASKHDTLGKTLYEMETAGKKFTDTYNDFAVRYDELGRQRDTLTREYNNVSGGVPQAPFAKNWEELAIKRAIRWAAENGYDRVAWTTGKMQADRYDLAKQVDYVRTHKNTDGTYELTAHKDGQTLLTKGSLTQDNLADTIGKDLANKIVNAPDDGTWMKWEGNDLSVGGEGMRAFYDQKIPNIIRKYIKKWGGSVGETTIAETMMVEGKKVINDARKGERVPSFDVTPAMRDSIMQGQPLFQNQSVLDLARQYGINTTTKSGGPNDKYIINIVKKYTGVDVKSIDEVTPELAKQAFEERRIAKGLPAEIEQDAKGGVRFLHDGRAVIRAFKGADVSTLVVWRRDIDGNDLEAVAQWGGFKDAQEFTDFQQRFDAGKLSAAEKQRYVDAEEQFARGFERYLAEDNESIPPKMQNVFQRFSQWLLNIYKHIVGSDIDVDIKAQFDVNGQTIRIKDVFDRMLFSEEQLKLRNDKAEILKMRPVGNSTTAFGADPNRVYNFRYRLVSLDDLIASHDQNFNLTPGYPAELQPRMRDRAASQAQVNRIASTLSPIALLEDTRQLDRGLPIIGSDMVVESGNGRTLALRMAAQNYPQNYQDYINELAARLPEYGLSEQDMQGLRNPVLVRERMDNVNRMDFVKEANQTAVLRMSPFEQALQDSESVNDTMLSVLEVGENQSIDQALQSAANINIIRAFVEMLPANERAAVVDANGNINSEGLNRLKNALFAKTYPGEAGQRLLKIFSESVNPVIKNIEAAMYSSLGNMAQAEGAIRSGYRADDLSIVDDISKAADVYARLKQNGLSVQDYLSQGSIFEQELNPFQQQLLAFIAENGRRSKALRTTINGYAVAVMNQPDPRQMGLFGEIPSVTKGEIFDALTREIQPEPEGLFAQVEAAPEAGTAPAAAEIEAAPVQTGRDKLAGVNILAQEPDGTTTYEINGETRNTGEGLFQTAPRDVTQTPEFKNWFGDSKVVDDEGDPLVVYHGSGEKFDTFDMSKYQTIKRGDWGRGIYFTPAKWQADFYRQDAGAALDDLSKKYYAEYESKAKEFGTRPMYESIDLGFGSEKYNELNKYYKKYLDRVNEIKSNPNTGYLFETYLKIENPYYYKYGGITDPYLSEAAIDNGHDGIIILRDDNSIDEIVVFNPEQIKSVNNRGTFDPNNPNILYQTPAIGKTSQTPETLKESKVLEESTREMIRPMLDEMREQSKNQVRNRQTVTDIPESAATSLRSYLNRVKSQMPSAKLSTMRMGEMTRDAALLNYQKRYPLDMALETVFPYQFWYTRTMMNWAMRMIDKPALFGMYAKFRNLQKKYEKKGVPSRLKGKLKNYASYLPDWAGGASYYDPMQQLFPPQQFLQPFEELATQQSAIAQQAVEILRSQAEDGDISRAQLDEAIKTRQGQLWETAVIKAKAEREEGVGNPFSLVTLMMSPALYLSIPYNIIKGTPEKISPLPGTRTAGAIETMLQDTPLDAVGKIVGLASRPERWARKAAGLSEFGEYGDFYVERQLSNMAAEGIATSDEVIRAMQDKQGALYDAAVQRVRMEQALRVPGALAVQAVKGGGTPAEIGSSLIVGLFPQSLFPEGELIHRGLKEEFDQAIKLYNMGDSSAFRKFFDEHPEYESRLALFKDPQERLRSYLVGKIWDQYTALTGPNKQIAQRQLGDDFNVMFLNDETRDYTAIDVDTLTGWARALGAATPQTANTSEAEANLVDLMPKEAADEIQKYWTERNQKFPNWNELQQGYFASGSNPAYLQRFPELQQYWEWKRSYELNNQTVRVYNRVLKDQYQQASGDPQEQEVQVIDQFQPQAQDVIKNYWNERDQKFKNWRAVQEGYYSSGRSKAYLAKFPELKQYWDWKRQQEQLHPEIKAYNEASKQYYEENPTFGGARSGKENAQQTLTPEQLAEMDDVLIRQVMEYYLTGNELSNGAATNLRYSWERQGKPGGYFEDYLNDVLRSAIIP